MKTLKTLMPATILAILLAASAVGCSGSDPVMQVTDPCGGSTAVTGGFVSASPTMSMSVAQCGSQVTGTLTYAGRDYDLSGEVTNNVFRFSTRQLDLCGTSNVRRSVNSTLNDFSVLDNGGRLDGVLQIRDASCASSRTGVMQRSTIFHRQ